MHKAIQHPSISSLNRLVFVCLLLCFFSSHSMAQWRQSNGPRGGVFWGALIDGDNIYAIGTHALYRSTDMAATWTQLYQHPTKGFNAIAAGDKLFLGLGFGLMYSTDQGASWIPDANFANIWVTAFTRIGSILFMATNGNGIFYTADDGENWYSTPDNGVGLPYANSNCLIAVNGILFAGTSSGVYASSDSGTTWESTGIPQITTNGFATDGWNLVACTDRGVYITSDQGTNWRHPLNGLGSLVSYSAVLIDTTIITGTNDGLYANTLNGSRWDTAGTGSIGGSFFGIAASNSIIVAASTGNLYSETSGGGIYCSYDRGATWQGRNEAFPFITPNCIITDGASVVAATAGGGVYRTDAGFAAWKTINSGIADMSVRSVAAKGANLFASSSSGVFRSTDHGDHWSPMNTGLPTRDIACVYVKDTLLYCGTNGNGIYVSANNGTTWTAKNGSMRNAQVVAMTSIGTTLFAATLSNGVYRLKAGEQYWSIANGTSIGTQVPAIAAQDSFLYAGMNGGGFCVSSNLGVSWRKVDFGYTGINVTPAYISATITYGNSVIVADRDFGIFISSNHGVSWQRRNAGIEHLAVNTLAICGDYLAAGIANNGIWFLPINQVLGVKSSNRDVPVEYSLLQNYPNPFNPTTDVGFRIPDVGFVTLKIFNILGEEVATLVNQVKAAGDYHVRWDASEMPSGVYFYRLDATPAGNPSKHFSQVRKMLLLR